MKLSERIEKFIWRLRSMWKVSDTVFELNRNLIDMTLEVGREAERRIRLEADNLRFIKANAEVAKINADLVEENERLKDAYEKILKGDWDQEVEAPLTGESDTTSLP